MKVELTDRMKKAAISYRVHEVVGDMDKAKASLSELADAVLDNVLDQLFVDPVFRSELGI